jgi:hypothetical protein
MLVAALYWSSITLVSYLSDSRIHDVFSMNCSLLRYAAADFALARVILQGILALAWMLKLQIPDSANAHFEGLDGEWVSGDVSVAFVLPQYHETKEVMSNEEPSSEDIDGQLGALLAKWTALYSSRNNKGTNAR